MVIPLAANTLLADRQLNALIQVYEEFDSLDFTHAEQREFERDAAEKVKGIILGP